ncbi:MAG: glycosyltransferase family 2 protein [Bacteroidetes bacterium]|jgi:glycosyltransferase involved in cell wall biosynthesis|nr:MAG: glycosyltransferase family 2 protein [Bacteroidota bacterium]
MSNSLVSVVMCTYNGSRFVGEQIESICNQTHQTLQVVIVDDASTDNTYEIVKQYAAKDPRVEARQNEKNLGFNLNFSKACKLATGDFIAIADQDDIWEPAKIEKLLQKIGMNRDTLLTHCISARFEKFGKFHLKSYKLVNYDAGHDVRNFFLFNFISGHNMLIRKELLEKALPFPGAVYYDWWLAAVASCNGKIEAVPEILVWHRMHDSNATGAAKPKLELYKQVMIILPQLMTIKEMKPAEKEFAAQLLKYYSVFPQKKISWPLFMFLFRHAQIVFAHKKRSFPWFSYIKHSFRAARAKTLA